MSRRPPRRQRAAFRPLTRPRLEALGVRGPRHPSVLAGPTCDSIDVIREDIPLPEPGLGDLVVGLTVGAYTAAHATDFNFIPRARIVAVNRRPGRQRAD